MQYPEFFNTLPTITLQDPLSDFLGTFENGIVEFSYLDIVKTAGHSCPTVSGAYLMTVKGLEALYPNEMPQRGQIAVAFKEDAHKDVTGVIANVITQITGATESLGFKGINGNFARNKLMSFNIDIPSNVEFKRLDTGKTVQVSYNARTIPIDSKQQFLMAKLIKKEASPEEKQEFGQLWQERVQRIFASANELISIKEIK